jgi:hypothetical protein
MLAILAPLVSWIFRGVVVKFVILTGIFGLMAIVIPYAITLIAPHIGVAGLTNTFAVIPSGVWWVLDLFNLAYGMPIVISAYVTRFLIRRLPLIG